MTPPKSVSFVDRMTAEKLIGQPSMGIISIYCSDSTPAALKGDWGSVLRLRFDDIEAPLLWPDPDSGTVRTLVPFDEGHALRVIDFLESSAVETMVVHCYAGISRSSAVAKFIAELYRLPFPEKYELYNRHVFHTLCATMQAKWMSQHCKRD